MNANVIEAKARFEEAEQTSNIKRKSELYFEASKLYLKAVPLVTDDSLKRSLIYLSSTCATKASNCTPAAGTIANNFKYQEEVLINCLYSERVLQLAHLAHLQRAEDVPQRMEANSVQVVRDMLALEAALADIGFVNPAKNKSNPQSSEQLLRSTFAFNSDLGESFMVLDTKGKQHITDAQSHFRARSGSSVQPSHGISRETSPRAVGVNGINSDNPRSCPPSHTRAAGHRSDPHIHPHSRDSRTESRQLQNTRSEIENELNNPLVQSYLSTHAPAAMAQSHFDFENLTQSTISTFNKDTIDNAEGVLNLLQTVRRIGDENAQLLLKIELLSHLEERSAKVYRDIDRFREEFEDKLECVRDMLEEFVEASAAFTSPVPPPSSDGTFYEGESSGNLTRRNPPLQALRDVIQKELEARRTAVAARKAAVEAEERLVREKAAARISTSPGGTGGGAGKSAMGIAEQQHASTSNAHSSATERASVVRQHQLEKMVKALVARQEKSNAEIKKKNELLDKYVRIINQFQKDHPGVKVATLDGSTMSVGTAEGDMHGIMRRTTSRGAFSDTVHSVPSMETVQEGESNAESEGNDASEKLKLRGNELKLDLAAAAVAASGTGGVVSTFRKPPSSVVPGVSEENRVSSAGGVGGGGGGGVVSPPRSLGALQQGMPMPPSPGAAVRTSSGGTSSALRKSSLATLPPRSKHHSTSTLEVLQKNAKL